MTPERFNALQIASPADADPETGKLARIPRFFFDTRGRVREIALGTAAAYGPDFPALCERVSTILAMSVSHADTNIRIYQAFFRCCRLGSRGYLRTFPGCSGVLAKGFRK